MVTFVVKVVCCSFEIVVFVGYGSYCWFGFHFGITVVEYLLISYSCFVGCRFSFDFIVNLLIFFVQVVMFSVVC